MARIVEILVGISALAGIATFLGFRALARKTVRSLGRKPDPSDPLVRQEVQKLLDKMAEEPVTSMTDVKDGQHSDRLIEKKEGDA